MNLWFKVTNFIAMSCKKSSFFASAGKNFPIILQNALIWHNYCFDFRQKTTKTTNKQ